VSEVLSKRISRKPQLPDELDLEQLNKFFVLSAADLVEIKECRGAVNKVGFALQLCSLRWFGFLLSDLGPAPQTIVDVLAKQLELSEPIDLSLYPQSRKTSTNHPERVREYLGFQKCDELQRLRLMLHLTDQVIELPRSANLIDVACDWLYEHQIVRPAARTLQDIVIEAKSLGMDRVYKLISAALSLEQKAMIDRLLEPKEEGADGGRSQLEELRKAAKRESTRSMNELTDRLTHLQSLGCQAEILKNVPLPTRQLLSSWGYLQDVWSLRRFTDDKRYSIVAAFLSSALIETVDSIVDMQDRLITRYHNQAKEKKEDLLRSAEKARTEAIEAFEDIGLVILDEEHIVDGDVRKEVFRKRSAQSLRELLADCQSIKFGADAHFGFMSASYGESRKYSPQMLLNTPFNFKENSPVGEAVAYLNTINKEGVRKLDNTAPTAFLSKRWQKHVIKEQGDKTVISRPHYEMALMSAINDNIKAGEVTLSNSRRWGDLEDLLIPSEEWQETKVAHYKKLNLPVDSVELITLLRKGLETMAATANNGAPANKLLKIDREKGTFILSPFEGGDKDRARRIKQLRTLLQSELPQIDLVDILIDLDNVTGFLRHFVTPALKDSKLAPEMLKRNTIAGLIAIGCNIGPYRMSMATPGISHSEISAMVDWYFTQDSLKAASIDLVNHGFELPITKHFGTGDKCSADGMRFYSPSNLLRTDYSPMLKDRGITMITHTADNLLMLHQQPVPCKVREAAYDLDGLLEHGTEMEPTVCFTDTHGYTETVLAAASLLGFQMAPRIKDIKDKTLYRFERGPSYEHLDPIIKSSIKTHLIHATWDEIVRVVASIKTRRVSASLILTKLSSYARQNSLYQGLREIGRIDKTKLILKCLHDEDFRRLQTSEINKGERSHDLDRFLFFGKQGALRSRDFLDQTHSFSCLAILHNAIVVWNLSQFPAAIERLRARGHVFTDEDLAMVSPLLWKHVNPFGNYDITIDRCTVLEYT
jgi:TnpA family transposase